MVESTMRPFAVRVFQCLIGLMTRDRCWNSEACGSLCWSDNLRLMGQRWRSPWQFLWWIGWRQGQINIGHCLGGPWQHSLTKMVSKMDGNSDSVVQSGPDAVVGVVSWCSSTEWHSGQHTVHYPLIQRGHLIHNNNAALSGMLSKFRSFLPISPKFMLY